MKFLAIEKQLRPVDWSKQDKLLKAEAHQVHQLYLSGILREIYFTPDKKAVLILESDGESKARRTLSQLPLVDSGLIEFELTALHPYSGYKRIIDTINPNQE